MFWKKFKASRWPEILFLIAISGLVYLPQLGKLSFHSDDWYFIYNGLVNGPRAFIDIALHTRPVRGPLYQVLFALFGLDPFPYQLTLYLWRLLGGFGALWLFGLLWPRQRQVNFFLTALFLVFPGFLWWVSGFEFQPYVLSLTFQVFSIVFTLKALEAKAWPGRMLWTVGALLTGWLYLALVEFAVGMEAFRLLAVFLFLKHGNPLEAFKNLLWRTVRASAVFLVIPFGFVFWYQFIFDNWRKAQQADVQLSRVVSDPLTFVSWLVRFVQGFLNVSLLSWAVPYNANFYTGRPQDFLLRFALAAAVIGLGILAFFFFAKAAAADDSAESVAPESVSESAAPSVALESVPQSVSASAAQSVAQSVAESAAQLELLIVGALGTLGGVLPVVVANRAVSFNFSQYLLPASLTGVLFLGGLVYSLFPKNFRLVALSILLGLATLTHQAIAEKAVSEEQIIYDFWWQVSWRAPTIRAGTTLLAQYPFEIGDGDSLIWGPANFIYYPETQNQSPAVIPMSALTLQPETISTLLVGGSVDEVDPVITNASFHYDYDNLLVLALPRAGTCVRVLNPAWPEFSTAESGLTLVSAPLSKVENILPAPQAKVPQPPFGAEPAHGWCYYYQKADLARQLGDWAEVARLGDAARKERLEAQDAIEWLPFVQAYAFTADLDGLQAAAKAVKKEPYYRKQACANLQKMNAAEPFQPQVLDEVKRLFCEP